MNYKRQDDDLTSTSRREINFSPPPAGPYSTFTLYIVSGLFFLISILSFLLGLSYIHCPFNIFPIIKPICQDEHYKYLIPLLIPVTAWFAIANWIGWEYFKYS
ncbi:uncharacterized protein I206_103499 [Kwoniella pini CBS 10737]|uniref:Uncharacterized protein n=1 Tax=Kwoniella pini CBS 10737 TaxID=1296096 RepID=A0A1B9I9X8_9TREE|nr:uncharacterized protein I206_01497 [Kwoniella pini CBS 10737]OCF52211.1 hypothetical protein I206_01497 [Kwoniella pini CBS 10737]